MAEFPEDTRFVVYCAGPHCNGANKAAIRLARLGYRVKEMIGGITGWLDEDFALERVRRQTRRPRNRDCTFLSQAVCLVRATGT